jgi:heterotetrameric sarcosine oxidase gamma subunit
VTVDPIPERPPAATRPSVIAPERLVARFAARPRSPIPATEPSDPGGPTEARELAAPQPAGIVVVHGARPGPDAATSATLPLGPDRWLAVHETLTDETAVVDPHGGPNVAEDVSDGFVRIRVAGDDARHRLATGVAIDLHPASFPAGAAAATAYREVFVVLHAVDDDVMDVYALRSFAHSLWRWLHAAAHA